MLEFGDDVGSDGLGVDDGESQSPMWALQSETSGYMVM